ncbi:MAG: glycosyltransferase [Candidatus Marinimicrobia bacterium]|nr:glycosyltransferase [Candidatus Neomarinimicrobiota bacterium]
MQRQFISYPKSGRSWIRFILFQLGLENKITFQHDSFEFNDGSCPPHNYDISRRLTHYRNVEKIVYLERDPRDLIVSLYHQITGRFDDFFNYRGSISEFIRDDYFGAKSLKRFRDMWHHLSSELNVLTLSYEECKHDIEGGVRKLLKFYNFSVSDDELRTAIANSTIEKMRKTEQSGKFPHPWLRLRNGAPKVRNGKIGNYRTELKASDIKYLDKIFTELNSDIHTKTLKILVAWFEFTLNGGIARFIEVAKALKKVGHEVEFLSLSNKTNTQWPYLEKRIMTLSDLGTSKWDAVMIPGAGVEGKEVKKIELLLDDRFGTRIQHVLNDKSVEKRAYAVNQVFKPHVVIFNNSHWDSYVNLQADSFYILPGAIHSNPKPNVLVDGKSVKAGEWNIGGYALKNPIPLIQSLYQLPDNVKLSLYGSDGIQHRDADHFVNQGRLKFLGKLYDDELTNFYRSMDIVVTTETHAGWCNTAAQAMAVGKPVILTQAGTIDFANDTNSLCLKNITPNEIGKSIKLLMNNNNLRVRIGQAAFSDMQNYTWGKYSKILVQLLERPQWTHYFRDPKLGLFGKRPFSRRISGLNQIKEQVKDHTILDTGCAEGLITKFLATEGQAKWIDGFEYDAVRVKFGNELLRKNNVTNAKLYQADLSSWERFLSSSQGHLKTAYDTVLFLGLYHHLPVSTRPKVLNNLLVLARKNFVIRTPENYFVDENLDQFIRQHHFVKIKSQKQIRENEAGTIHIYEKKMQSDSITKFVTVMGMHRSGTSMMMNVLNKAGFYIGESDDIMGPRPDNPNGFFERQSVVGTNDLILSIAGGAWDEPPSPDNISSIKVDPLLERVTGCYQNNSLIALKDPRLCLTFPVWRKVLPQNLKIIVMDRDKEAVVRSLMKRNKFTRAKAENLYDEYIARMNKYIQPFESFNVSYKALLSENRSDLLKGIQKFLEIDVDLEKIVKKVVDRKLDHSGDLGSVEKKVDRTALVSIIIPVFNKLELTKKCLKAIKENTRYSQYEVIIIDNASTDNTPDFLQKQSEISNYKVVSNDENHGFVKACNHGATEAEGEYLLFLNNDTEVQPGWLTSLVQLAERRPDCGAVGSKLVYPDGKLQEAGGIIFSDGSGWNFGRGNNPGHPAFNFVREVDYCSGASLMIRKSLWDTIGGFDKRYSPAYYEDTDLCFAVRKNGFKVYYQPASVVVHYEGQTAGTDLNTGFKRYQKVNAAKFLDKWRAELSEQSAPGPSNVVRASQRGIKGNIFIADQFLPAYDRASGSLRLFSYIKILREMGYHVTYMACLLSPDVRYIRDLQNIGVEVWGNDGEALKMAGFKLNREFPPINYDLIFKPRQFDYAILSFWYIAQYFIPRLRKITSRTKIIVDTVDIHFIREIREAELKQDQELKQIAKQKQKQELAVYNQADEVWVVTENDRRSIAPKTGNIPIDIIPNIHEMPTVERLFDQTSDLLFVGNFSHTPNVDAVLHFHKNMWPAILVKLPDIKWYIVGNNPPESIKSLANDQIIVTGYVEDLTPYLQKARISISPLRYGAGMKGKIGEALSWMIPVVTTSIGAEGMSLEHRKTALVADKPEDFVASVVELYHDQPLWTILSENGRALVERNWSTGRIRELMTAKFDHDHDQMKDADAHPLVSIIMLTWNALEYTKKCMKSIEKNTSIPFEIVFVDNASTDGTVKYLNTLIKKNPHYKLIRNRKNMGFAEGNNQGVAIASGKYIILLNNDVLVPEGWLGSLVESLERDENIGAVGPITNYISGRQALTEVPYDTDEEFFQFASTLHQQNQNRLTPRRRLAGFAVLMKKSLYDEIGGFDTSFGVGNFEDDDLSLRIREKGLALMVDESVLLHHFGSQTFKANRIDYQQNLKERLKLFHAKWPDVDYEELLEIRNGLQEMHPYQIKRATALLAEGHFPEADALFREIYRENPLDEEALFGLAICARNLDHSEEALRLLHKILKFNPADAAAYNQSGIIVAETGDLEKAHVLISHAIDLEPTFIDARRNLAEIQLLQEDYTGGVQTYISILDRNPDDIPSLLRMAQLHEEAGNKDEAVSWSEKVLALDPENPSARELKQAVLAQQKA